ncbi:hypothetical protein A2482_02080 [Candidatus Falkowbacteria bacterium RIFOXYC2_FULL_48_21]|uniref:HTH cro/C1-type domain-containing protein n=1 Tax=Candidatus Falkowbacteria bacterium RIFOXYC2_FULL_48_21 TaxID=1798005 RepID=A0A1F5T8T8_9BACT|nr:MAG: hypothetical protein A2482_02080 [Candidatus Falkowbacteria bacterium RIFOXYC2_FULL_48_21]
MSSEIEKIEQNLLTRKKYRDVYNRMMTDVFYRAGRMVKEARVSKGLSQAELAKKLKTHQSVIARLENSSANISLGFLDKVAKALNTRLLSPRFESLKEVEDEYDKRVYQNLRPVSKITMRLEESKRRISNARYVIPRLFPITIGSKSNK